jgi:hypothetical protein
MWLEREELKLSDSIQYILAYPQNNSKKKNKNEE